MPIQVIVLAGSSFQECKAILEPVSLICHLGHLGYLARTPYVWMLSVQID